MENDAQTQLTENDIRQPDAAGEAWAKADTCGGERGGEKAGNSRRKTSPRKEFLNLSSTHQKLSGRKESL